VSGFDPSVPKKANGPSKTAVNEGAGDEVVIARGAEALGRFFDGRCT
jgi:hypothetical protein